MGIKFTDNTDWYTRTLKQAEDDVYWLASEDILSRAKALCMWDTGRLRASLHYVTPKRVSNIRPDLNGKTHYDDQTTRRPADYALIGTVVHYAIWVERRKSYMARAVNECPLDRIISKVLKEAGLR